MNPLRICGIIENGQQLGLVNAHICPEPVNSAMFEFESNDAMLAAKSQHCNMTCPLFRECQPEQVHGTRTQINGTGKRMRANSKETLPREIAEQIFPEYPGNIQTQ